MTVNKGISLAAALLLALTASSCRSASEKGDVPSSLSSAAPSGTASAAGETSGEKTMEDNGVFPFYNAGNPVLTYDCSDGNTGYYITGTSREDYIRYGALLKKKGYRLSYEHEIRDNLFRAYTRDEGMLYTYYTGYSRAVRIIRDISSASLPKESGDAPKVAELSLTQMVMDYDTGSFGMGYIITLEDGRFIVIDGGYDSGSYGNPAEDSRRLFTLLRQFNRRADGRIVIAAWFLTHDHPDHFNVFHNFTGAFSDQVTLESFAVSVPDGMDYSAKGLYSDLKKYGPGLKLIHPHSGQVLSFGGVNFEILFTHEDFYPTESFPVDSASVNELSLVMRMTAGGQTVLFPADMEEDASGIVCAMYGDYLKSDMVQIAHHGYHKNAATAAFYDLVDPAVILWPHSIGCFNDWRHSAVNQHLLKELNSKEILVADKSTKRIFLPYEPGSGHMEHWIFANSETPVKLNVQGEKTGTYHPAELAW